MLIQAIPTEYGGVTFRSRLEASWAEWFDMLMMPWEYEPCVLTTPIGRYIPDFFVAIAPGPWDWVLEVKPEGYQPTPHDSYKWAAAETALPNQAMVTVYGPPDGDQIQRLTDVIHRRAIRRSIARGEFMTAYADARRIFTESPPPRRDPYDLPELTPFIPSPAQPPEGGGPR